MRTKLSYSFPGRVSFDWTEFLVLEGRSFSFLSFFFRWEFFSLDGADVDCSSQVGRLFVFCSVVVVWTVERFRVWIHNVIPGVFDEFFC